MFYVLFYSMILAFTHVRCMSEHPSIDQKTSCSDSLNTLHLPGTDLPDVPYFVFIGVFFFLLVFFFCVKAFVCQVFDLVKG